MEDPYLRLAEAYLGIGNERLAIGTFRKRILISPNFIGALAYLPWRALRHRQSLKGSGGGAASPCKA
jgi:hypothetical protein